MKENEVINLGVQYEFIQCFYPVDKKGESLFSDMEIWVDLFAEKRLCAYDPQTNEVKLIRKERKKLEMAIYEIVNRLIMLESESVFSVEIMESFAQTLNELSVMLKEKYPEKGAIEFGSLGFEGGIQVAIDTPAHERHAEVIVNRLAEEYGDEFFEDIFDE